MTASTPRRATVDTSPVAPPASAPPPVAEAGTHSSRTAAPDKRRTGKGIPAERTGMPASSPLPLSGAHPVPPGAHQAAAGNQNPAGSEQRRAAGKLPAGPAPRSYMLVLPPGLKLLNLNDRTHWAARHRRSQSLKKAAWAMALQAKIPVLERVVIVIEYQPPDRRWRDPDNVAPSAKALIDGCVAAGCLINDDSRYVAEVTCRIGQPYPKGRLLLHLTEVGP